MTLVAHGHAAAPDYRLLNAAPVDSRIVIEFTAGHRYIYRKQPNGLWRATAHLPGRAPAPMPGELSGLTFSVFDRETWRLHHPGLVRVTGRYRLVGKFRPGQRRTRELEWRWACTIPGCEDRSFGGFLVDADAQKDARAHVDNHLEAGA